MEGGVTARAGPEPPLHLFQGPQVIDDSNQGEKTTFIVSLDYYTETVKSTQVYVQSTRAMTGGRRGADAKVDRSLMKRNDTSFLFPSASPLYFLSNFCSSFAREKLYVTDRLMGIIYPLR